LKYVVSSYQPLIDFFFGLVIEGFEVSSYFQPSEWSTLMPARAAPASS